MAFSLGIFIINPPSLTWYAYSLACLMSSSMSIILVEGDPQVDGFSLGPLFPLVPWVSQWLFSLSSPGCPIYFVHMPLYLKSPN